MVRYLLIVVLAHELDFMPNRLGHLLYYVSFDWAWSKNKLYELVAHELDFMPNRLGHLLYNVSFDWAWSKMILDSISYLYTPAPVLKRKCTPS